MDIYWMEQTESDVPSENQWLSSREATCLSRMRFLKRRTDWRLGRWTAKHALASRLNLVPDINALAMMEILAAPSGAPEVFFNEHPAGIAISISHSGGTALCATAPLGTTFGCDVETIEPRSDAFVDDYFTVDERALIERASVDERPLILALLWSGKESALKALRVGLRLDARCMSVSPADAEPQSAAVRPDLLSLIVATDPEGWHPLRVRYSGAAVFKGWWRAQDHLVRTVVCDRPLPPPMRSL